MSTPIISYGVPVVSLRSKKEYWKMPISNLPANVIKVRTRWRHDRPAVAFVKTATAVERWVLQPDGDSAIKLGWLDAVNTRT